MKNRILKTSLVAIAVAVAAAFTPSALSAQSASMPDTKPGQIASEWFKQCSSPDLERLTKWEAENVSEKILKRRSAKKLAEEDVQECTENGGYRVVDVTESKPNSITLTAVGNKSDAWISLSFNTDAAGKIESARINPANPPESTMPSDLSDRNVAREIKATVDKLSQAGLFSGIVQVARGTRTIAVASGGYANNQKKAPITGSTQFTLGSMGKMFTAAAVGQLVDQKKMSFDDTVGKFFPNYPNETVRDKVTVGMLLSHTAGLGDFLSKRTPEMMKKGVKRADEFMPLYNKDEPKFAPGTSWAYSNAGLALAGAIVEKVSGEAYPDYIRKHIFEVAGMKNSDPNNIPHSDPRMVTPYTRFSPQGPTDWHEAEHDIGSPAGGAISTADDLVRFADALRGGKLVSKATFDLMAQPHGNTPFGSSYGYAMEIDKVYGQTVVGHGGGFPGVSTHLYIFLNSPYTLVVLANQDPPAENRAGAKAEALIAEKVKRGK